MTKDVRKCLITLVRPRASHSSPFPVNHMHGAGATRESPAYCLLTAPRSPSSPFSPFSGMGSARHLLSQVSLSRRGLMCALLGPWLREDRDSMSGLCFRKGDPPQGMSPSRGGDSGTTIGKMMENRLLSDASPGSGLSPNSRC